VFRPGTPVTALSLARGATSLYLTGLDGQIWSNFFPSGGHDWSGWFALGPNTFPLGSQAAAVSTEPGGTSLFVVGLDEGHGGGRVWTNSFPDPAHPNQWVGWRPLGNNVFRPGSPVTALSLARDATSLYLTGLDGQLWSNFFPSGRHDWSGWFALGPNTFPLGSKVATISTVLGGTSLFVVGLDSQVWSTFFSP
jgi:hypothetical protein